MCINKNDSNYSEIAFAETAEHIKILVEKGYWNENVLLIGILPEADYEAGKYSLPYKSIEDLFDPVKQMEELTDFKKTEEFCSYLDGKLEEAFPGIISKDYFDSKLFFYDLKMMRDSALGKAYELYEVFNKLKPKKAYFIGYNEILDNKDFCVQKIPSVSNSMIEENCRLFKCEIIKVSN